MNADGEAATGTPRGVRAMAAVRWVLVGVMALAAVAAGLYATGTLQRLTGHEHPAASTILYQCPMHPAIVQDHPGTCPICGMTLVARPAAEIEAHRAPGDAGTPAVPGLAPIQLTPERIQLTGMKTARVARRPLRSELRTVGVVAESERGLAQINTRFAGWVQKLLVPETGRQVRRGQVLATIYSPDVLRAQQEFLTARQWSSGAATPAEGQHGVPPMNLAEDARRRLELLGLAEQEIAELAKTGQAMRDVPIRAPVSGTVIRRDAVEGSYVQPGASLFTVADLSTVWVIADVHEYELRRVRVGQPARLELTAYPGQTFTGKVQFLYPALDPQTRTMRVRLEFPNRKQALRPGMYGTVYLTLPSTAGLAVPVEAVVDTGETQYLFVARDGGRFEPRKVKLGARGDGEVEILDGVQEGETVVTTANFLIDSESRLRAAIEGQTSGGTGGQTGAAPGPGASATCAEFDGQKYPDKLAACRACEIQHRGMGSMVDDCKNAIPRPWR
jgi:Cu(I)/Ag(I) efflux system membrane fusion protein